MTYKTIGGIEMLEQVKEALKDKQKIVSGFESRSMISYLLDELVNTQQHLIQQRKELNRLRVLEQGLSDFQNEMLPGDTAASVFSWIESTTGFKNIYKEDSHE